MEASFWTDKMRFTFMTGGVPQRSVKDPLTFFSELLRQEPALPLQPSPLSALSVFLLHLLFSLSPSNLLSLSVSVFSTFCSGGDQMLPDHMLRLCQCGSWTRPNGKQWGSCIMESSLNSPLLLRLLELFFSLFCQKNQAAAEGGSKIITPVRSVPLDNLDHNCCV